MTNEWDGMTHDYTRKGGIVHAEIMLPANAPPEFADRSILWNSVEQIEKARNSQLAREIEAALPRELSGEQQLPQLREIMSYDELELDRMGDRRTATFFCISDTDSTYNFLVALAFSQMFNLLCERADNVHGGRLPHHVRVLWDEAANTGQVPNLEKLVAVIRSREISLCLLYQQLAQCKAIYDKNAETILGNMDSVLFLGGREASTIKEISENWLGKATISMQTEGRSRGQSESYSQNTQRLGRELMTPSELATMPGDRCILQLRGLPPFYSKKYDLKQHPNYRFTAEADKVKNAFDLDRLIDRRRRPGMNEECEVYEVSVPDEALTDEDEDILNYDDLDDPDAFV